MFFRVFSIVIHTALLESTDDIFRSFGSEHLFRFESQTLRDAKLNDFKMENALCFGHTWFDPRIPLAEGQMPGPKPGTRKLELIFTMHPVTSRPANLISWIALRYFSKRLIAFLCVNGDTHAKGSQPLLC